MEQLERLLYKVQFMYPEHSYFKKLSDKFLTADHRNEFPAYKLAAAKLLIKDMAKILLENKETAESNNKKRNYDGEFKCKIISTEAKIPERKSEGAAGFDLIATDMEKIGSTWTRIKTGVILEFPSNYVAQVHARSSYAIRGIEVHQGIIDSDYRGEITVLARWNKIDLDDEAEVFVLGPGEAFAQILFTKIFDGTLEEAAELTPTKRGKGGFGSTTKTS